MVRRETSPENQSRVDTHATIVTVWRSIPYHVQISDEKVQFHG